MAQSSKKVVWVQSNTTVCKCGLQFTIWRNNTMKALNVAFILSVLVALVLAGCTDNANPTRVAD